MTIFIQMLGSLVNNVVFMSIWKIQIKIRCVQCIEKSKTIQYDASNPQLVGELVKMPEHRKFHDASAISISQNYWDGPKWQINKKLIDIIYWKIIFNK